MEGRERAGNGDIIETNIKDPALNRMFNMSSAVQKHHKLLMCKD